VSCCSQLDVVAASCRCAAHDYGGRGWPPLLDTTPAAGKGVLGGLAVAVQRLGQRSARAAAQHRSHTSGRNSLRTAQLLCSSEGSWHEGRPQTKSMTRTGMTRIDRRQKGKREDASGIRVLTCCTEELPRVGEVLLPSRSKSGGAGVATQPRRRLAKKDAAGRRGDMTSAMAGQGVWSVRMTSRW
jgi:hypothetical protein